VSRLGLWVDLAIKIIGIARIRERETVGGTMRISSVSFAASNIVLRNPPF